MAALLKEDLNIETELIKGHGGIFEVAVNGVVVSKKTAMGFPEDQQVLEAVREAISK